jgi:hypothetical protein
VVAKEMAAALKIDIEELQTPSRGWRLSQLRTMIAYVLVRRGGYAVKTWPSISGATPRRSVRR